MCALAFPDCIPFYILQSFMCVMNGVLRPRFCTKLDRGQPRLMRWILLWIMPQLQDLSFDLLTSSPARYGPSLMRVMRAWAVFMSVLVSEDGCRSGVVSVSISPIYTAPHLLFLTPTHPSHFAQMMTVYERSLWFITSTVILIRLWYSYAYDVLMKSYTYFTDI